MPLDEKTENRLTDMIERCRNFYAADALASAEYRQFYVGNQYVTRVNGKLVKAYARPGVTLTVTNYFRKCIARKTSIQCSGKPWVEGYSQSDDTEAEDDARTMSQILEGIYDELEMNAFLWKVKREVKMDGWGYIYCFPCYDERDSIAAVDPETGEIIEAAKGRPWRMYIPGWSLLHEPGITESLEQSWCVVRPWRMPIEQVRHIYREKAKEIHENSGGDLQSYVDLAYDNMSALETSMEKNQLVYGLHVWIKPCEQYPKGMHQVRVGMEGDQDLILSEAEWPEWLLRSRPYRYPFVPIFDEEAPGAWRGIPSSQHILTKQVQLNMANNAIMNNLQQKANTVWLAGPNSKWDGRFWNNAIIEADTNSAPGEIFPKQLEWPAMDRALLELPDRLKMEMDEQFDLTPIDAGRPFPDQNQNTSTYAMLMDNQQVAQKGEDVRFAQTLTEMGSMLAAIAMEHPNERGILEIGGRRIELSERLRGKRLMVRTVASSMLRTNPTLIRSQAQDWVMKGLLTPDEAKEIAQFPNTQKYGQDLMDARKHAADIEKLLLSIKAPTPEQWAQLEKTAEQLQAAGDDRDVIPPELDFLYDPPLFAMQPIKPYLDMSRRIIQSKDYLGMPREKRMLILSFYNKCSEADSALAAGMEQMRQQSIAQGQSPPPPEEMQ